MRIGADLRRFVINFAQLSFRNRWRRDGGGPDR